MEKNEQNKETNIGKPAKILERRNAIFFDNANCKIKLEK